MVFLEALTQYHGKPEPLHETASVLAYEAGKVLEHALYAYWNGNKGDDRARKARIGFLKSELADVIAQSVLICEQLGVDFEDIKEMGIEKAMERFTGKEHKE